MRVLIAVLFFCCGTAAHAGDLEKASPERLIDALTAIDCNGPDLYPYMPYDDFWAVVPDKSAAFRKTDKKNDCVPKAMRALVRLGPAALPALIRHIDDARSTRLDVGYHVPRGTNLIGGQFFDSEYDPRQHVFAGDLFPQPFIHCNRNVMPCGDTKDLRDPYRIRVGDICYVLIGQITNRRLVAARYQMTGIVIVNSPVEIPSLAEKVRRDWTGVGAEELRRQLLADLHARPTDAMLDKSLPAWMVKEFPQNADYAFRELHAGALRRLRFYYPDTYAALAGDDLAERRQFEMEERQGTGP